MDNASFQAKIREFESRIRRWRQLKFGFTEVVHPRRSTSTEPKVRCSPAKAPPAPKPNLSCSTSPLPRKNMAARNVNLNLGSFQPVYDPQQADIDRRFEAVQCQSGILNLAEGQIRCNFNDLRHIEDLGNGSCGHVSKMSMRGQIMAVKQMARTSNADAQKRILMDLDVIMKCHSPYIVICYGYFITDSRVCICMEEMATCLDRFLAKIAQPVPEKYIGKMALAILKALNYLKGEMNIIHRDIKPSNVLLDWDGNVKLCDFGIAGQLIESRAFTRNAGCPPYMAPERFASPVGDNAPAAYDVRSDVWSVGITLVELATAKYPIPGQTEFEILANLTSSEPPPSLSPADGFTPEFCDFINLCLKKDVEERPKYDVLLRHPFIARAETSEVDLAGWFQSFYMSSDVF